MLTSYFKRQTTQATYYSGPAGPVAYPLAADNVSGPLLTRLRGINQPVIRTGNEFLRPRLALVAGI